MAIFIEKYLDDLNLHCKQQKWDKVIDICNELMDYASHQILVSNSEPAERQEEAEMHQLKGNVFASQGKWSDAIAAYKQAIFLSPGIAELYSSLAKVYLQQEDWPTAAELFYKALQLNASLDIGYRLLAVLEHLPQKDIAEDLVYKVFQASSQMIDADAYFKLGNFAVKRGNIDRAVTCYQEAIASDPSRADFHFTLGTALAQLSQWSSALSAYEQVLALNPKSARAYYAVGECHLRQKALDRALKNFQLAVDVNPKLAAGHAKLGQLWHQKGDISRALRACLEALKHNSNLSDPFVKLRYNILRYDVEPTSGLLNEVVETCHLILQQEPDSIPIQSLLGYTLTRQANYDGAIQYYQRASLQKAQKVRPSIPQSVWQSQTRKPSFVIIGAFKCATTSVYQYINRHPNVLPSLEKELDFFDFDFKNGLDWYFSHFPPVDVDAKIITGEATPNYFYNIEAPERISEQLPGVKLLLILRDPVSRAVSHYNFLQRNTQHSKPIEEVLEKELESLIPLSGSALMQEMDPSVLRKISQHPYIGHSLYVYYLRHWLKHFDPDQLLVLRHEDLAECPEETLANVFDYLDLPAHTLPEYKKYKLGKYSPISSSMEERLRDFFRPHTRALEELLNRQFSWDGAHH